MRKRIIIIVVILALAGAGGYYAYSNNNRPVTAARAQTATVMRGNLTAVVASAGPVAARAQVGVNFSTSSTVKNVFVKIGDKVKQGQVLAEADAIDLQFALANAYLAMNQAQIQYARNIEPPSATDLFNARTNAELAQMNYESAVRKVGLNEFQLLTLANNLENSARALRTAQSNYDKAIADRVTDLTTVAVALQQAKLDYASAQANYKLQVADINDSAVRSAASSLAAAKENLLKLESMPTKETLDSAQSQLDQAKRNLEQAQNNMKNAQLIAPFDGTITQVNIYQFSATNAGNPAIQIADLSRLQVTVNMAEIDVSKIKVGQNANITFDALSDRPSLAGVVEQVALVGVTTQGVVNYPVIVRLMNPDTTVVKTGMTANISIIVEERDNVLLVPNRAIRTSGRQRVVQVQNALGVLTTTPVTVGLQNETNSEILTGLKEGDVVVITTTTATTPGGAGGFPGGGIPGGLPGTR